MGSGFQIIPVGKKRLVQSVPGELSMDHAAVLQQAQVLVVGIVVIVKGNKVKKQNINFVCAAPFLKFIYVVTAWLRGENAKLHDLWRTWTSHDEILFLFFFLTWMWLFGIQLQESLPALVSELE